MSKHFHSLFSHFSNAFIKSNLGVFKICKQLINRLEAGKWDGLENTEKKNVLIQLVQKMGQETPCESA